MGPGILILLLGTIAPLGGVADDLTPQAEADLQAGSLEVDDLAQAQLDAERAETHAQVAHVNLAASALEAQVQAAGVSTGETATGAYELAAKVRAQAEAGWTLEETTTEIISVETGQGQPAPAAPSPEAATEASPGSLGAVAEAIGELAGQAAPAAAVAAIAVSHADPWWLRWRRLAPIAGLYSRISRSQVLDHETRAAIYDLLQAEPGLSLGEITERLELSRSTARHHVRKLEEAEMIRHTTEGRCRIHFPIGAEEEALVHHVLANENRERIYEILETRPLSMVELARVLEANPGSVAFHLKKLREAGLVERFQNGSVRYRSI